MSGKSVSLIASSSALAQPKATADKLDQFVEQLLKSNTANGTVAEILNHPQVKKHGLLGRLSASQQNLVTSVVSLMQDKVSADAKQNADALKQIIVFEREALSAMSKSFAETAKSLYQLPLLTVSRKIDDSHTADSVAQGAAGGGVKSPTALERFLTWGNLVAVSAVLLTVLVIKTSVSTANFETKYHLTEQQLTQLQQNYDKLQVEHQTLVSENKALAERYAALNSRQTEADKQETQNRNRYEADLQQQKQDLLAAQQTIARQQAQLEQANTLNASLKQNLNGEISALQQELAGLKGKESERDEQNNLWKKLAEERKEEIAKLQAELQGKQSATTADKSKFLGLF
ncbi:MAG TPA: hypothetical protein VFM46_15650 [Pseudomonadales bacterium]|nr:hypothetical protein [Pseudomonadales bacterium]